MARKIEVELDAEQIELFEKLRIAEKLVFTNNGRRLTFISTGSRGAWKSYPQIKLNAQRLEISLKDVAKTIGANYQCFVNACNGRQQFRDEWKPIVANILGVNEKELFNED